MLERRPWPLAINCGPPSVRDIESGKDVQNITSEGSKMSNHGFKRDHVDMAENDFCSAAPQLGDNSAATHDPLYNYTLNHIPQTASSFFDDDYVDKESGDLLYGWSDIGNFEDVDNMLRSCDLTFGLESFNNEDEFCWLSSQQTPEPEAAATGDSRSNKLLEIHGASVLKNKNPLTKGQPNPVVTSDSSTLHAGDSAPQNVSAGVSDTGSQNKDVFYLDEQTNPGKKQTKLRSSSCQVYPHSTFHQSGAPDSYLNHSLLSSDHISKCNSKSGVKSENTSGLERSNDMQRSEDMLIYFPENVKNDNKSNTMVLSESAPVQVSGHEYGDGKVSAILDSSNASQENSCVSSVVDGISPEATSFSKLQSIIEQLDVRTKLCIRDSLYRLAKSAEERHNGMNPEGGDGKDKDAAASHPVTEETDKYASFIGLETDTNPIDRSIAHLLFHRPSDSSLVSSENDVLLYKSRPIPNNTSPSLRIEETRVASTDTEAVASDKNK